MDGLGLTAASFFRFGFSAMLSSLFPANLLGFWPPIADWEAVAEGAASLEPGLLPP